MNTVLVALGYGDEGKGAWCEFYAETEDAPLSIRYNGGCQGVHYTHMNNQVYGSTQYSASSWRRLTQTTVIGPSVLISPTALLREANALAQFGMKNPLDKLVVTPQSPLLLPAHYYVRSTRAHFGRLGKSTTGVGVGELMDDISTGAPVLTVGDLFDDNWQLKIAEVEEFQFSKLRSYLCDNIEQVNQGIAKFRLDMPLDEAIIACQQLASKANVAEVSEIPSRYLCQDAIFDPAQATLIDRSYGFQPDVTSVDTTVKPAFELLPISNSRYVGLIRAYNARHGRGFFATKCSELSRVREDNGFQDYMGCPAYGWLDMVVLRYAISVNDNIIWDRTNGLSVIDYLAVSCLDQLSGLPSMKICYGYQHSLDPTDRCYFEFDDNDLIRSIKPGYDMQKVTQLLSDITPIYEVLPGWLDDIAKVKHYHGLPRNAQLYLKRIGVLADKDIGMVSVGPTLEQRFPV